jgi:hypothetical protein
MSTSVALPPVSGLLFGHIGSELSFAELTGIGTASAVAISLRDVSTSDTVVTVTDVADTGTITVTITAGQSYARQTGVVVFPTGATLTMTIDSAGADAMGLSGSVDISFDAGGAVPSSGPGLITAAEFFAANQIGTPTIAQTDFVDRMIDASSDRIREDCHRWFNRALYVDDYLWPHGIIYARDLPLVSVSACTVDGMTIDPASLYLDLRTGQIGRGSDDSGPLWWGVKNLHLEYEAGYTVIPTTIREALYRTIYKQLAEFDASGAVTGDRGPIVRQTIADVGTIQYDTSALGGGVDDNPDWLTGIPPSVLAKYQDLSQTIGQPVANRIYTVTPT